MKEMHPEIRNAVRALIVREDCVLLLRKFSAELGEFYALPGGGQITGETLEQTLARECLEEIDAQVEPRDLIWVADYFRCRSRRRHLIELVFLCEVPESYSPRNGHQPDRYQQGVVWLRVSDLGRLRLAEPYLAQAVARLNGTRTAEPTYLGAFRDPGAGG